MKPGDETQLPAAANDNACQFDRRYPWWPQGDDSELVVSYETRLASARREAAPMGWRLERSKARSQYAPGHGLYRFVDANDPPAPPGTTTAPGRSMPAWHPA
jgi:hypothetical protein